MGRFPYLFIDHSSRAASIASGPLNHSRDLLDAIDVSVVDVEMNASPK
jgi:hypothetical protein